MLYSVSSYRLLPQKPGVYQFLDNHGGILYVGKAKRLKDRVSSYFAPPITLTTKTRMMVEQAKKIRIILVESELEALLLEANLIKKYSPKYNINLKDGKNYPLIRIRIAEDETAVLTARKMDDENSIYFGPYPNSSAMRMVIRTLRRIFPFQSVLHHGRKACLYHHLHLCPCLPAYPTLENRKTYKKTIKHITDILEGNIKKVVHDLEKERNEYAKKELFEKAADLQKQIDALIIITQPKHQATEYLINPNLRSDIREQELKALQEILIQHGVPLSFPTRIECYDNSNIQGTNPTSSMVVLTDGEIDKSQYRKFKIKTVSGPDDFASMQEVLARRLKHSEWPLPQLFIVDGGKGQISAALIILKQHNISIPLVGLAKREETIITSDFQEIHLPKSSPALQLVMRIRDEAHRFAINFHRKLRNKHTLI